MKLVVVSPEGARRDEIEIAVALFSAGLERYHVRKPGALRDDLSRWIERVPACWRDRLVLHQHHELVDVYGLGGRHWRDAAADLAALGGASRPADASANGTNHRDGTPPRITSRSCHDLASLRASLGVYDAVFFGPVFASISKPAYGPKDTHVGEALGALLHTRTTAERQTAVIAIGGITVDTALRARVLGFDGVAVLGALWQSADPVATFQEMQRALRFTSRPIAPAREAVLPRE